MRKHKRKITRKLLIAANNRILDRVYKDMTGGTQYGVDMPTLRAVFPARAKALDRIGIMYRNFSE